MKTIFWIKLANQKICICALNPYVREYCKNYIILPGKNELPDILIEVSKRDIEKERKISEQVDLKNGEQIRYFSDEYLETLVVYRKIAEKLLEFDTILFHGSALAMTGKGYVFTAKSGTGKSTHTNLWQKVFGSSVMMVNDDKPLIMIKNDEIKVFGTPWDGKHRRSNNVEVFLKSICIIERGNENYIYKCSKREVYSKIISQVYIPNDSPKLVKKTLELVDLLMENVELYRLECNMEMEAVRIAYKGMEGERNYEDNEER